MTAGRYVALCCDDSSVCSDWRGLGDRYNGWNRRALIPDWTGKQRESRERSLCVRRLQPAMLYALWAPWLASGQSAGFCPRQEAKHYEWWLWCFTQSITQAVSVDLLYVCVRNKGDKVRIYSGLLSPWDCITLQDILRANPLLNSLLCLYGCLPGRLLASPLY